MELQLRTETQAPPPATARAPAPPGDSGKAAPAGGKELPARPAPTATSVQQAVAQVQNYLRENQRQLQFQVDDTSGRTVIRVVNPANGELIRQIPSEEVLQIAAAIDAEGVRLLDTRA